MSKECDTNIRVFDTTLLIFLLFALTFCGEHDMHDKLLAYTDAVIKQKERDCK